MNRIIASVASLIFVASTAVAADTAFPLKVGPTGRYLVDQNNQPFLISADGVDDLPSQVSLEDANFYFANRKAKGFNTVWFQAIINDVFGGHKDGSTIDGIVPFTTAWDFSTPNPAYFARLDELINLAASHGFMVLLGPIETGGLTKTLRDNGKKKAFNYGVYLGNRYKSFKNILWNTGNDYVTRPQDNELMVALIKGIQSADPNHLHTTEYNGHMDRLRQNSLDDPDFAPLVDINSVYTYAVPYAAISRGYHQSTESKVMPVWLGEAKYEASKLNPYGAGGVASPEEVRRQAYWAVLAGACGGLYGHSGVVWFTADWKSNLDSPGAIQIGHWKRFFDSYKWFDLVPDEQHRVVTSGYGTLGDQKTLSMESDYLTAASTPDGSLVIAYAPTLRTFTVDMSKLSGPATARWFDPTDASYTAIKDSPILSQGARKFTPPGKNHNGDGDWVLVLDAGKPD